MILDIICIVLIVLGMIFFFGAVIGLLRFPDFYTRMHAAGKGDTLSSILILAGFAIYHLHSMALPDILVSAKILFIVVFIFLTSPTSTHALMRAGYEQGEKPWTRDAKDKEDDA